MQSEEMLRAAKNVDFGAFDVALNGMGQRCVAHEVVERNHANANAYGSAATGKKTTNASIWRRLVRYREVHRSGRRPDTRFDNCNLRKRIALGVAPKALCVDGIWLEAEDFTRIGHATGCQERKKSDISAKIVKNIARPEALGEGRLGVEFGITGEMELPGARMNLDPEPPRRAALNLSPNHLAGWQDEVTDAVNQLAKNRNAAERTLAARACAAAEY